MHLSADHIKTLHKYEIRILQSVEYLMNRYSLVPVDEIVKNSRLSSGEVEFRIAKLMEKGMVKYAQVPYPGYTLVFNGYDTLAVSHLVKKGIISSLGSCIGEGKESRVYEALGTGPVILKLHRIGQRSFQTVRKGRSYLPEKQHCPWVIASHFSAEQEYLALSSLQNHVNIPTPLAMNRNVIAMTYIPGDRLSESPLENPNEVLEEILSQVHAAYKRGYIHGDLSEYNVMYDGNQIWIIDWPQWVSPNHENAAEILDHDLETITKFFFRRYRISSDMDCVRSRVTGC
ncbi:serine/threonine-protein kinase RIO2 [Methanospirillum stamsii]|uniref:non-specific serine/threonine protein kinase n=1 Tax=Methanospirillum stamsii TaxID=1277351 RepID=A0A2V2NG79_9EURY|nr:RIO1 family regulatory kinase/ATPase [Methanospirillum stamsii]PWR75397.1 serine/threonine protein phosphatase [Methanospirillum stamsii]